MGIYLFVCLLDKNLEGIYKTDGRDRRKIKISLNKSLCSCWLDFIDLLYFIKGKAYFLHKNIFQLTLKVHVLGQTYYVYLVWLHACAPSPLKRHSWINKRLSSFYCTSIFMLGSLSIDDEHKILTEWCHSWKITL